MNPSAVEADRAAGTIIIEWVDGHRSVYPVGSLRWACPCAECMGEWGRPGRLSALQTLPVDETELVDVLPVGHYAITPVWASGHQTGIYSWEYLRSICPCQECASARR